MASQKSFIDQNNNDQVSVEPHTQSQEEAHAEDRHAGEPVDREVEKDQRNEEDEVGVDDTDLSLSLLNDETRGKLVIFLGCFSGEYT